MSEIAGESTQRRNPPTSPADPVAQVIVDADDLTADDAWLLPSPSVGDDGHVGEIIIRLPVEEPRTAATQGLLDDRPDI